MSIGRCRSLGRLLQLAACGAILLPLVVSCAGPESTSSDLTSRTGGAAPILTPVAPASDDLTYDIVIPDTLFQQVRELKTAFIDGLAVEVAAVMEGEGGAAVEVLADDARALGAAGDSLRRAVHSIGRVSATFGIPGVYRLLPMQGAVRDTLFGFVVWHEDPKGRSIELARELKRTVVQATGAAAALRNLGGVLEEEAEVGRRSRGRSVFDSTAVSLAAMAASMDLFDRWGQLVGEGVADFQAAAAEIRGGGSVVSGTALNLAWAKAAMAAAELVRVAGTVQGHQGSVRATSRALGRTVHAAHEVSEMVSELAESRDDLTGGYRMSWTHFREDIHVVVHLKEDVLAEWAAGFSEEAKGHMRLLLGNVVAADRALAELAGAAAVRDVTSTSERLLEHYKRRAGYGGEMTEEERGAMLKQIDAAMGANYDLQAALVSMHASEAALADGRAKELLGYCTESKAIIQYKNAWLHALSAGASSLRGLEAGGLE